MLVHQFGLIRGKNAYLEKDEEAEEKLLIITRPPKPKNLD